MASVNRLARGVAAGLVGTFVLDVVTYADVAVRGRPPSEVPADTVGASARRLGLDVIGDPSSPTAANRRAGISALAGYGTGAAVGALYAAAHPLVRPAHVTVRALGVGAVAMLGANAAAVVHGATDPRHWGVEGWLADVVPHVCFGLATAVAFDRFEASAYRVTARHRLARLCSGSRG